MCEFKEYTKNVEKTREFLSIRVTFFSKPNFLDEFINKKTDVLGDSFSVRQLTEKEGEAVDVDTISHILSIPLDYILKDKCVYIFNNLSFDGKICRVIVSQYFIFIQIKRGDNPINTISENLVQLINLNDYKNAIDLADISIIDDYVLGCERDSLWEVLDKSAFGDIDIKKIVESRYADVHDRDEFEANMVRCIIRRENSDNKIIYQIFLKSIVSLLEPTIQVVGSADNIAKMKEICEKEVTRCYSNNYCK